MGYIDNKVKVTVIESKCPKYKVGDVIESVSKPPSEMGEPAKPWR